MNVFEEGYVPQGWSKGEMLYVRNIAGGKTVAIIMQAYQPYHYSDTEIAEGDIAALEVTRDMVDKANEWLRWWRKQ